MSADTGIKQVIEAELRRSPDVDGTDIIVVVNGGDVILSGFADNYRSKYRAEIEVRRVEGVTAVANDIRVRPLTIHSTECLTTNVDNAVLRHRTAVCHRR